MSYNHKDIVIFFSSIISKIINWVLIIVFILFIALIIYGMYVFIAKPYKPGEDPIERFWDRGGWTKSDPKNVPPASTYINPALFEQKYNITPIMGA